MELYFLREDASLAARFDPGEAVLHATWPDVSPDGTRIAFVSVQGSSSLRSNGIFIASLDGSSLVQITLGDGTHPRWSPDGTRIAYTCENGQDVCVINADGSERANLTADSERADLYPSWTPDGRIVFMSERDAPEEGGRFSGIYIMDADGGNVTRLTGDENAYNAYPSVSPDGERIVYESDRDVPVGSELYVMDIDGGNQTRITNDPAWNQNPVWSPDGTRILYAANYGDGNIDLYQINADGTNRFRLTQNLAEDGGLRFGHAWLPEPLAVGGFEVEAAAPRRLSLPRSIPVINTILFAASSFNCEACLETGIYGVTSDGATVTPLEIEGFYPAWSPDFRRFAFTLNGELYIASANGREVVQVTSAYRGLTSVQWHARRDLILSDCTPYVQHDVCLIDLTTGAINNLTEEITADAGVPYPSWYNMEQIAVGTALLDLDGNLLPVSLPSVGRVSPDGTRLVTISEGQVVVTNVDGSNPVQITSDEATKGFPIWSPDGEWVVYSVAPGDGALYLYISRADGSETRALVPQPIAAGPVSVPPAIETYYGYSWAP